MNSLGKQCMSTTSSLAVAANLGASAGTGTTGTLDDIWVPFRTGGRVYFQKPHLGSILAQGKTHTVYLSGRVWSWSTLRAFPSMSTATVTS
jgi:hypothetical protein